MPAWDLDENQTSESFSMSSSLKLHSLEELRSPFKKYGPPYAFEGAENLQIPCIAYTGNAHCSDYHGKMGDTPLRVRIWYSTNFDKQLLQDFLTHLTRKLQAWKRAASGHKNISSFCGLVQSPGWGKVPSLVVPLYEMDINQYLRHTSKPKADPLRLLLKVAGALAYMHSLNPPVVHGAIRGENIHIDENGEPKLVDLGLEHLPRSYGASEDQHDRDHVRWLAPELVDFNETDSDESGVSYDYSTPAADVWSFGMTMLEVLSGQMPWADYKWQPSIVYHLIQGGLPQRPQVKAITDPMWNLMLLCFERDPSQRISMEGVRSRIQFRLLSAHAARRSALEARVRSKY